MRILPLIVWLLISFTAWAADPAYDATKRQLTIPSIVIGDTTYMNLVVQLDSVKIVDMGGRFKSSGPDALPTKCPETVPKSTYDAIALGMSVDQVNKLLGCRFSQKSYSQDFSNNPGQPDTLTLIWFMEGLGRTIGVLFDPAGKAVTPTTGDTSDPFFKYVTFPDFTLTQ